jgi:hypothetical protein
MHIDVDGISQKGYIDAQEDMRKNPTMPTWNAIRKHYAALLREAD